MIKNVQKIRMLLAVTVIVILVSVNYSKAQSVAINNNGAAANTSAMLDISSTTKGVLIPRMASSDRTAIASPAEGLIVYDSDTKGFWYYSNNIWNEIPKSIGNGGGGIPTGPADGDLSGNYPAPNVVRIQNLNVASGMPLNKQIMKWDSFNNRWQAENDSLFLPYTASLNNSSRLLSLTNPSTANYTGAILGKSGAGSGTSIATPMGVWGDNDAGTGVLGSSNSFIGVQGISWQHYGVFGMTNNPFYAGVYGINNGNGGVGVMGEISGYGSAIYGLNTGDGNAGKFAINNTNNTDDAVSITTNGYGRGLNLNIAANTNASDAVRITSSGMGRVLYANISNTSNATTAASVSTSGTGGALNASIFNANSYGTAGTFYTSGKGSALNVNINNIGNTNSAAAITTTGLGNALYVTTNNANNNEATIYANSTGSIALEAGAKGTGIYGWSSLSNAGIGVQGEALQSDLAGVGVKGISHSTNFTSGALTGINSSTGVAVYGQSIGGIAVYGKTTRQNGAAIYGINDAQNGHAIQGAATGTNGVAIYGEGGNSGSLSYAGYFRNSSAANPTDVLRIDNLGTGNFLSLTNGLGDTKTTIAKNGNITTDGTITVKTNMGIIRNSASAQLRYDVIPATVSGLSLQSEESIEITVNFPTSFSAAPVISVGNTPGNPYYYSFFATAVGNVTTTNCKFSVRNVSSVPITMDHTWKLIAIGPE